MKKKLTLLKLTTGTGIFSVSAPGWITAVYGGKGNPSVMLGGGALVVAGIAAKARMEHWLLKDDAPVSYVHSMRQQLKPKTYARELIQLELSSRRRTSDGQVRNKKTR